MLNHVLVQLEISRVYVFIPNACSPNACFPNTYFQTYNYPECQSAFLLGKRLRGPLKWPVWEGGPWNDQLGEGGPWNDIS